MLARLGGFLDVGEYHRGGIEPLDSVDAHNIYLVLNQGLVTAHIPNQAVIGNILECRIPVALHRDHKDIGHRELLFLHKLVDTRTKHLHLVGTVLVPHLLHGFAENDIVESLQPEAGILAYPLENALRTAETAVQYHHGHRVDLRIVDTVAASIQALRRVVEEPHNTVLLAVQ